MINTFVIRGPVILGVDDTIERRRGTKIKAKGTYRDPVRSSHNHFVKASGLRWLSLMLLAPIPWVQRVWALPFLSVVAPCERYYQGKTRRHKKLTEGAQLPIRWVIVRDPKKIFKTQALLCRDINISAEQIIQWFIRHWRVEVTFHEVRTHLGEETQRQWTDLSILRITPALLGLFSLITLLTNVHAQKQELPIQETAW